MAAIHTRMPVILPRNAEAVWLDRSLEDPARLLPLLVPYSAENMDAYAVSPAVNSPRNDSPACIEPAD
jgi:putative SOS response-associated peptidase YedK